VLSNAIGAVIDGIIASTCALSALVLFRRRRAGTKTVDEASTMLLAGVGAQAQAATVKRAPAPELYVKM
jgi:hypothetical protein